MTQEEKMIDAEGDDQKCILLCVDFISYKQGHSIQSDCIFGNSYGDIAAFSGSKYIVLHDQAHKKSPINCI